MNKNNFKEITNDNPEEINKTELMEYYGLKGKIGYFKLTQKIFKNMVLQSLAERAYSPKLSVKFHKWKGVKIGKNVYIGPKTFIDVLYPHLIKIEDYVSIGYSMIFAHSNPTNSIYIKKNYFPRKVAPVNIKKGAWMGAGCIVLPGVTIGENSVVAAGSVVIKNIEKNSLYAGVPAKKIQDLKLNQNHEG
jgi:acetyltransferase-like isoleucine patch superfamily enzyme